MKKCCVFCFFTVFVLLLFLFSLSSCQRHEPEVNNRVFYGCFDTVCVIYDYSGMEKAEFDSLANSIQSAAEHYHRLFDIYQEYDGMNNLATVNRLAGAGEVKVSREIIDLISFSMEMHELTGGKVNVAMGSVLSLWHSLRSSQDTEKQIPSTEQLSALANHISIDSIVIDKEKSTVSFSDPQLKIDVGAIAKGYSAQLIKEELIAAGHSGIVLDFGGNLCAVGARPDGSGWESKIRNPLYFEGADEPYARTVTILNDSLVTSGVYERYYTVDGKKYHHIIDPETLMPENRYLSVTVQTQNSGAADALSTAIFNMEPGDAESFVKGLSEKTEVTLIFSDGSVKIISNLPSVSK